MIYFIGPLNDFNFEILKIRSNFMFKIYHIKLKSYFFMLQSSSKLGFSSDDDDLPDDSVTVSLVSLYVRK